MRRLATARHRIVGEGAILKAYWASNRSNAQGMLDRKIGSDTESIGSEAIADFIYSLRYLSRRSKLAGKLGIFGERESALT